MMFQVAQVRTELLCAIRGKRSQLSVSRKMGYSFNQVGRWESGQTRLLWSDFDRFCQACRQDLNAALKTRFPSVNGSSQIVVLLRTLVGSATVAEVSRVTTISRDILSHIFRGKTSPTLDQVLTLLWTFHPSYIDFLGDIVELKRIPSLHEAYQRRCDLYKLYFRCPWVGAVERCFELDEYRNLAQHQPGFAARRAGLDLRLETEAIQLLLEIGAIRWRDKKYDVVDTFSEVSGPEAQLNGIIRYWLQRAEKNLKDTRKGRHYSAYRVFTTSTETYDEIRQEYAAFHRRVSQLIAQDKYKPTELRVLVTQLFDPGES